MAFSPVLDMIRVLPGNSHTQTQHHLLTLTPPSQYQRSCREISLLIVTWVLPQIPPLPKEHRSRPEIPPLHQPESISFPQISSTAVPTGSLLRFLHDDSPLWPPVFCILSPNFLVGETAFFTCSPLLGMTCLRSFKNQNGGTVIQTSKMELVAIADVVSDTLLHQFLNFFNYIKFKDVTRYFQNIW